MVCTLASSIKSSSMMMMDSLAAAAARIHWTWDIAFAVYHRYPTKFVSFCLSIRKEGSRQNTTDSHLFYVDVGQLHCIGKRNVPKTNGIQQTQGLILPPQNMVLNQKRQGEIKKDILVLRGGGH